MKPLSPRKFSLWDLFNSISKWPCFLKFVFKKLWKMTPIYLSCKVSTNSSPFNNFFLLWYNIFIEIFFYSFPYYIRKYNITITYQWKYSIHYFYKNEFISIRNLKQFSTIFTLDQFSLSQCFIFPWHMFFVLHPYQRTINSTFN